jgi:hypothetical protein
MNRLASFQKYVSSKWWFYLVLIVIFFIPSFSAKSASAEQIPQMIAEVLRTPFIFQYEAMFIVSKIIFIFMMLSVFAYPKIMSRYFTLLSAAYLFFIAVFQNMSYTETFGFTVLIGNVVLHLIVVTFWVFELFIGENKFKLEGKPVWKWWVVPFALFAFWMPISCQGKPDFNLYYLLTNESMLTYCMITPVLIAILTLFFPHVNIWLLRVTSFVGMIFGIINVLMWFVFQTEFMWVGVLHIPLLVISVYGFLLSIFGNRK